MLPHRRYCDGVRRRDVLRVGVAGMVGASVTLPRMLRAASAPQARESARPDVSLIVLFLEGGLSTIDTLDLKPDAPPEFRGEFDPIATSVPGVEVCEHLPNLARVADRFALVRHFTHGNSNHGLADHYMLTGYDPRPGFNASLQPNNQHPAHGAVMAKELGPRGPVPPYVCLPKMHNAAGPAFLGSSAAPFVVNADPNSPNFEVADLAPPLEVDASRLTARRELLATIDRYRQSAEVRANADAGAVATFRAKAFDLMTSQETKDAFDIAREPEKLRDQYGRHSLGQSCLMARRLVEAGVRCVTIDHTNWDTHYNNFHVLKHDLLPHLDAGLPALLTDLDGRGLLETTLVVVMGEFGRTPRVNKDAGRDHWGPANTILLAGGGVAGGRCLGATNARGEKPAGDSVGPEDLAATIFRCVGIDGTKEFHTPEGRPVKAVNDGHVVAGLF
jgi:uncharacterized protein (DUF1501 family)